MIYNVCLFQVLLGLTLATELLPERFLQPQDFNHHPFTDVGIPASLKKALKPTSLYAILSKKRPREGRQFPPQDVVIYPTPHPSLAPRKDLDTNEVGHYDDPYLNVPKNYAFSYRVKDHHSGDDFSHSQAHNGKATRGQYRVKLPDGRTQIVNYTADHKGYRADVQYEHDAHHRPSPFSAPPHAPPHAPLKPSPQLIYTLTATPVPHAPLTAPFPLPYVAPNAPLALQLRPTAAPHQHHVSTTAAAHYVPLYASQHGGQQQTEHAVIVTPRPAYSQGIRKTEAQQSAPVYYRLL